MRDTETEGQADRVRKRESEGIEASRERVKGSGHQERLKRIEAHRQAGRHTERRVARMRREAEGQEVRQPGVRQRGRDAVWKRERGHEAVRGSGRERERDRHSRREELW
jgi:hypothetical protein